MAMRYRLLPPAVKGKYRGSSLMRNTPPVGPYSSPMPRDLVILGGWVFLMIEVPLHHVDHNARRINSISQGFFF